MSLMYGDSADVGPIEYYEYEGYYPGSACAQIRDRDPDGWEHQPTEADYANHRAWAIRTFGEEAWHSYRGGRDDPAPSIEFEDGESGYAADYAGNRRELEDREPGQ